jgi:O-antigen ligase
VDRAKSIVDMSQPSNYGRIHMWETGLKIWLDHPVLGTGDIDLHRLYEQYKQPDDQEYGGHLHNNFVHLFVTLGLVGFIVVMALWWKIWSAESAIHRRSGADREVRNAVLGSMAIFAGFLVNGFFEWNFGDHEIMVFVWFSVGLALAAGRLPAREEP